MLDKSANILVVDDTFIMRESLRRILAGMGYENVVQAENGREAVKAVEDVSCKIDVVFLDIVMPIMDGKMALKKIRETNKSVSVIMLTSVADKDSIVECSKLGMTSYILKPINAVEGPDILKSIFRKL